MKHCLYYQAQVKKEMCWFLVGVLRSYDHMAFDRTVDKQNSIFEFFVPELMQKNFELVMGYFLKEGVINYFRQMDNRLKIVGEKI